MTKSATDIARESVEPRKLAVVIVCPMPLEPTEDDFLRFRQAVDVEAFYAQLRRMAAEMDTEHDFEEPAA